MLTDVLTDKCTLSRFTRLTTVLALVISGVLARPLHELEHAGTATATSGTRTFACSCGHLHGSVQPREQTTQNSSQDNRDRSPGEQRDGTHSHHSCGICLAFWLQTQAMTAAVVSLECLSLPVAGAAALPPQGSHVPPLPPLRGPPALQAPVLALQSAC